MTSTDESAAEAAVERAAEEPEALTGEDVAAVLRAGAADTVQFVASTFLQSVGSGDAAADAADAIAPLLDHDEEPRRAWAATLLADLAVSHPDAVSRVVDELHDTIGDDSAAVREATLRALANVSDGDPDAVSPATDAVASFLEDAVAEARHEAAACLANVARADPRRVAAHVPALLASIGTEYEGLPEKAPGAFQGADGAAYQQMREQDWETRKRHGAAREEAAEALAAVAGGDPDAVAERGEVIREILLTAAPDDALRATIEAVGTAAEARPAFGRACIDALAPCLAATERIEDGAEGGQRPATPDETVQQVAGAAAWALGIVAEDAPEAVADAVVPHLPDVLTMLESPDPTVRARATGLLSYVAETEPTAAMQATDALVARLEDEAEAVRWGAATALGYGGSGRAREPLATVAAEDESDAVRGAATRALERLDGDGGGDPDVGGDP